MSECCDSRRFSNNKIDGMSTVSTYLLCFVLSFLLSLIKFYLLNTYLSNIIGQPLCHTRNSLMDSHVSQSRYRLRYNQPITARYWCKWWMMCVLVCCYLLEYFVYTLMNEWWVKVDLMEDIQILLIHSALIRACLVFTLHDKEWWRRICRLYTPL